MLGKSSGGSDGWERHCQGLQLMTLEAKGQVPPQKPELTRARNQGDTQVTIRMSTKSSDRDKVT